MLIEGNVVWLDFIRIWVPMFGCRRTRLHSPQSELFPDEEIVFPFAILFCSPDLFFTIFTHGSVGLWSDRGSFPQLAQVCFSAHSRMGELSSFDPQRISIYSCMASIWKSQKPHAPGVSICTWDMILLHFLVMYSAVTDRIWLPLFHRHASQFDLKVVSILGFTDRGYVI